jgi:hypothetical protein
MTTASATNEHLVWSLEKLSDHQRATRFAMQFQKTLCVYSGPVQQLYTNYEIIVPEDDKRKLLILPNPYAFHDTFNHIPETAVRPTGFYIVPDERGALLLHISLKDGTTKDVPLKVALNAIRKRARPDDPFLPVVTKGDLREFRKDVPSLHLHRIVLKDLLKQSDLEKRGIQKVVEERMKPYLI